MKARKANGRLKKGYKYTKGGKIVPARGTKKTRKLPGNRKRRRTRRNRR